MLVDHVPRSKEKMYTVVNLTAYMDPAPYVIIDKSSLRRAFRVFRALGLRHLLVINAECKVKY